MSEEVNTGGLMKFGYKEEQGKLDEERRNDINKGYIEYEERKKREKRNKIIIWAVIALVVLAGIGYWLLR